MRATSVVTVLLPLVPVMPTTGRAPLRANSSMSPMTSMPCARAAAKNGSASGRPGEATTQSAPASSFVSSPPTAKRSRGYTAHSMAKPGGSARESVPATSQPRAARWRITD